MRRAPLLGALCAVLLSGCAATAAAPPAVRTVDSHPPSAATIAMRWQWLNPEINSFTFRETKDVFAFRDVAAPQEAWTLARAEGFAMPRATVDGREASYDAWADRTFTNAMLVMRDGRIVFEDYRNRMAGSRTELLLFDALDIEKGPIATIQVPIRLRFGFHGNFATSEELGLAKARESEPA